MAPISFARGAPAPELLPGQELAECARAAVEADPAGVLSYGAGGGYGPLREWLAEQHGVEPGRILLTSGSLQGFVFLAQHLLGRGGSRRVLVEAPTYDRPLKILAALGAEVETLPLDDDGLDPDLLARALDGDDPPAFLYTIPTFQNPSGLTLAAERRRALVDLARERELLVLEDDPYGRVRFEGDAPPTLHELAAGDGVVYASSFSKTVAPGIRVGWFVLPPDLAAPLESAAADTYISPPFLPQAAVLEFLRRGLFEPNLERVNASLRERRDAMLATLDATLAGRARWSRPEGGYFLWLDLPRRTDATELLASATAAGVVFVRGADFFPRGTGGVSAARLAYSYASVAEIRSGIERLAALV